jgi:RND family efflux transporter, MFP subunit
MFESSAPDTELARELGPNNNRRRRLLRTTIVIAAVILLLVAVFFLGRRSGKTGTSAEKATESASMPVTLPVGVDIDEDAAAAIGLKTAPVEVRPIDKNVRLTGTVEPVPDARGFAGSRVEGKIAAVFVNVGDRVAKGQLLAQVQSTEFEILQVDLLRAAAELHVAEAAAERMRKLLAIEAVAQKDVQNAAAEFEAKRSEFAGVRERLEILGLNKAEIAAIERDRTLVRALPVTAPLSGVVVSRKAVVGSPVNSSDPIFEIDNLATVWIEGDVFESQMADVKAGLVARVTVPAYPGKVFEGRVQNVAPSLGEANRTARLRVVLPNADGLLKPEMFATISVIVGSMPSGIAVPNDAIIEQGGAVFVFVKNGEQFVRQDVVVSVRDDLYSQISNGLLPNDVVVTDGKSQVYTKFLYQ